MNEKKMPKYRYSMWRPWLIQFNGTYLCCLMCHWQYHPRTRDGLAKAIRQHRSCGFNRG